MAAETVAEEEEEASAAVELTAPAAASGSSGDCAKAAELSDPLVSPLQVTVAGASFFVSDGATAGDDGVAGWTIPLADLPPLPTRDITYWTEARFGLYLGLSLSAGYVVVVLLVTWLTSWTRMSHFMWWLLVSFWTEGLLATVSFVYLISGRSGEIRRSRRTCYPIPAEVQDKLRQPDAVSLLSLMDNVPGPADSKTLGKYCVRCLVWRPPRQENGLGYPHHCRICQRCVVRFDHHCGLLGRCIVWTNFPFFVVLVVLMPVGFVTTLLVAVAGVLEAWQGIF